MTKKDFFILLIKIFGLFSIITNLFSVLPGNISIAFMDLDPMSAIWIIIAVALIFGLFVLLVFKAEKIVILLKLEEGFEEDRINFGNLKPSEIIKVATFIIGGMLILHNIPVFLNLSFFAFKHVSIGIINEPKDNFNLIVSGINIVLGYLLLTNYSFVSRLFEGKKIEDVE